MIQFRLRVKQRTFVIGGEFLDIPLDPRSHLWVRVDEAGEAVTLTGNKKGAGAMKIGKLVAGECASIPLEGLTSIRAETAAPYDTFIDCTVTYI